MSTGTSGNLSFVNTMLVPRTFSVLPILTENLITTFAGSDAMISSNTFGIDCISNLSDRSPDSNSVRNSGSMMIVRFAEFQFDSD